MVNRSMTGHRRNLSYCPDRDSLQEYKRFQSTLLSNLPGMVYRCRNDADWTMEYVSDGCFELTGYSPEDLIFSHIISFNHIIHPDDRKRVLDEARRALERNEPYKITYRIITAGGQEKWVWEQGRLVSAIDDGEAYLEGFITDTTDHMRAEEAMRKSQAKLDSIFRSAPAGIGVVVNRVITEANERLCEMTGYAREELLGRNARMLYFTDEEYDFVGRVKYNLIDRTGTGVVETQWCRKDGTPIDILLSSSPIDRGNMSAGVTFTALDITERKRAEEEFSRLATIVMSSDDAILSKRLDGTIISWNRGAERLYGYTAAEAIGHPIDIIVPPERAGEVTGILEKVRKRERIEHYETERITKDGRRIVVSITISPLLDNAGHIIGASTIARDITEQKRAEKALKKSQFILAKSQEMAHVGNWAWNVQTNEANWSDEGFRIFGYLPQAVKPSFGWLMAQIHPEDRPAVAEKYEKTRLEGWLGSFDYRIVRPDGSIRYVNTVTDKIVRDRAGKIKWVYGITQDITVRKQSEIAMEEAKARSELYLDLMGHDINNMNQIALGFLEVTLSEEGLDGHQQDMLMKSLGAIKASSRLIDNVRKLQQASSVRKGLVETDVDELLRRALSTFSKVPGTKATIRYSATAQDCTVIADELLYDVFTNIVGNAVKHGGVEPMIDIWLEETWIKDRKYCRIAVEDDGPGIPDNLKEKVFDRMRRGDTKARGSGLGLYLVKTLVESYGGLVWAEDRVPGDCCKGSRFVMLLPAACAKGEKD